MRYSYQGSCCRRKGKLAESKGVEAVRDRTDPNGCEKNEEAQRLAIRLDVHRDGGAFKEARGVRRSLREMPERS